MIVVNNETIELIKQDIDLGNTVFAGSTIAQYIESKNPHENLTLALRSIKEDLKEILLHYPDMFIAGQIHYSMLEEVLRDLNWIILSSEYNSQDCSIALTVETDKPDITYAIFIGLKRPFLIVNRIHEIEDRNINIPDNETEGNNC